MTNTQRLTVTMLCLWTVCPRIAVGQADHPACLEWDSPSVNSHGSMPIGNGDIGANVWMEPTGVLDIMLSKTDAWDGNGQLCKLGQLRVTLTPNPFENAATFRQELDLRRGRIVLRAEHAEHGAAEIRFWIDANQPVARVQIESDQPLALAVEHHTWRTEQRPIAGKYESESLYGMRDRQQKGTYPLTVYPDTVLDIQRDRIVFFHRNVHSIWDVTMRTQALDDWVDPARDPLMHRTFGAIVRGPGLVSESPGRLASTRNATRHRVSIYPLTQHAERVDDWVVQLERNIAEIQKMSMDDARAAHERWWGDFWDRHRIVVSGDDDADLVTRGYALQRWINACGGRGGAPIKFNGSIFTMPGVGRDGKWTYNPDYRTWGSCYWWQNTRLPYWPMLAAGDYELMRPLFKMYLDALPLRKHATRKYYRHDGAHFPEVMYFFGTHNNENYGWHRENMPDGLMINRSVRYEWVAGIELSAMMLDYYSHTQDERFLREQALPLADEVVTFYAQHYQLDDQGKLHIYPSNSLEDVWDATNPAEVVSGLRSILPRMIALADDPKRKRDWGQVLDQLPELPRSTTKQGEAILTASQAGRRRGNGENSELYALFPFRLLSLREPGELPPALQAYNHRRVRSLHGWAQYAIFAACLGLADDARSQLVARSRNKHRASRFPAFWGPNFDWVPDQDHGGINMIILQEMLMQPVGDKILLLPAWPTEWDVDFKLHAPHRTTLEGTFRNGRLQTLHVNPLSRRADVVILGEGASDLGNQPRKPPENNLVGHANQTKWFDRPEVIAID